MNKELEKIADAWNKNTGDGRDEKARDLAKAYVNAHPETYAGLEGYVSSLPEDQRVPVLVATLSQKRDAGDEEGAWEVEAWLLACVPPQNIGGAYAAEIQMPNR